VIGGVGIQCWIILSCKFIQAVKLKFKIIPFIIIYMEESDGMLITTLKDYFAIPEHIQSLKDIKVE
jgi:hypothetical protein